MSVRAANVRADRDSEHRQLEAIQRFAKHGGFQIVDTFRDPAVSSADPIGEDRFPVGQRLCERAMHQELW